MNISQDCFNLLEGLECGGNVDHYLVAYKCPAGKWTIGMGNTYYSDGSPVKEGDILTHNKAVALFYGVIQVYEKAINDLVKKPLKQCQFDALVSFVYNIGVGVFSKSTLLAFVNQNPNDVLKIRSAWTRWVYFTNPKTGKKEVSKGLTMRRDKELELYFKD